MGSTPPVSSQWASSAKVSTKSGCAWRVMYVAKFADAVYVLHAFQKKTQQTAKSDIELAAKRYKLIGG
jgi:phage-related protein